ncbi:LysM peptidoglycan-binding domain-containing protein [Streptomyces sp. NPDC051987]|uniref:LysM peptidoglycan-binding domain-containing protein n=1 Tax=Streptomyces sp. NPDC051987 TaxID=3155808 RepID=UPI00342936D8
MEYRRHRPGTRRHGLHSGPLGRVPAALVLLCCMAVLAVLAVTALRPVTARATARPAAAAPASAPAAAHPVRAVPHPARPARRARPARHRAAAAASRSFLRLRPGDTLWAIARGHATTVAALQHLNRLGRSTLIYAGRTLQLPAGHTTAARRRPDPRAPPVTRPRAARYTGASAHRRGASPSSAAASATAAAVTAAPAPPAPPAPPGPSGRPTTGTDAPAVPRRPVPATQGDHLMTAGSAADGTRRRLPSALPLAVAVLAVLFGAALLALSSAGSAHAAGQPEKTAMSLADVGPRTPQPPDGPASGPGTASPRDHAIATAVDLIRKILDQLRPDLKKTLITLPGQDKPVSVASRSTVGIGFAVSVGHNDQPELKIRITVAGAAAQGALEVLRTDKAAIDTILQTAGLPALGKDVRDLSGYKVNGVLVHAE